MAYKEKMYINFCLKNRIFFFFNFAKKCVGRSVNQKMENKSHYFQEKETTNKSSKLFFLDIKILQDKNQFITSCYKFGVVSTLIFCCCVICSSVGLFHKEIIKLKHIWREVIWQQVFWLSSQNLLKQNLF